MTQKRKTKNKWKTHILNKNFMFFCWKKDVFHNVFSKNKFYFVFLKIKKKEFQIKKNYTLINWYFKYSIFKIQSLWINNFYFQNLEFIYFFNFNYCEFVSDLIIFEYEKKDKKFFEEKIRVLFLFLIIKKFVSSDDTGLTTKWCYEYTCLYSYCQRRLAAISFL